MNLSKRRPIKINSWTIQFLDKTNKIEETEKRTYVIKPMCIFPQNVFTSVKHEIQRAVEKGDKRKAVITIRTSKGAFVYNRKHAHLIHIK